MVKQTISPDKFAILKKYKDISDKIKALDSERKEILLGIFERVPKKEDAVSLTVRGEGIAFVVQKQETSSVAWSKLAKENMEEDDIASLKPDYTKSAERFLVKF